MPHLLLISLFSSPTFLPFDSGITIGVKIFGPVFGFMLGSVCTSIYVDFPFGECVCVLCLVSLSPPSCH